VIPPDFKLVFRYSEGGDTPTGRKSWSLTISADGKAVRENSRYWSEWDQNNIHKSFSLSQKDLKKIISSIKESDFFTLRSDQGDQDEYCMDCARLTLSLTMDGKSHGFGTQFLFFNDEDIKRRFWFVSKTVLKIIPSPNNNKELKMLEEGYTPNFNSIEKK
jgi:hypothetical protein